MIATIQPHPLAGTVWIPASKSVMHRNLIAAALSDRATDISCNAVNQDILATINCLSALGARIEQMPCGVHVEPLQKANQETMLDCGESGSTLRFLLPVAAALGCSCTFIGSGRLPMRPNAPLIECMRAHGICAGSDVVPLHISGRLCGGEYALAGNISSQYITGLLFALPLCGEDSTIRLTTPLESASYIEITAQTLQEFGIRVERTSEGWRIPGGQRYRSPGSVRTEGDWSAAAFWMAANALGARVQCEGMNHASVQGDRAILTQLERLGTEIDVSDTPDLVPALAVAAAAHMGTTRIVGATRLRLKESDRLSAVTQMLRRFGTPTEEFPDGLTIHGGNQFQSAVIDGANDHRIVMAAAVAAAFAQGPVQITDAQAVRKSYPAFFDDFNALGGLARVEPDR